MKYIFLICCCITGYGFLPVSFLSGVSKINNPNTLLIRKQECGCPCPGALILNGGFFIPPSLKTQGLNILTNEINITGDDPYKAGNAELATHPIMV
jgi:hypothetical protein